MSINRFHCGRADDHPAHRVDRGAFGVITCVGGRVADWPEKPEPAIEPGVSKTFAPPSAVACRDTEPHPGHEWLSPVNGVGLQWCMGTGDVPPTPREVDAIAEYDREHQPEKFDMLVHAADELARMVRSAKHIVDAAVDTAFTSPVMRLPAEPECGEVVRSVSGKPTWWRHFDVHNGMPSGWYEIRDSESMRQVAVSMHYPDPQGWVTVRDIRVWAPTTWACLLRLCPEGFVLDEDVALAVANVWTS